MAVTAKWFTNGPKHLVNGDVDWESADIRVSLHTASYTPSQDGDETWADVDNEVSPSGTGYTAGGKALTSQTVEVDAASNETRLKGDATTEWTAASFTCRYAIIHAYNVTAANDYLLGYVDFGGDETVSAGTFTITWDADGMLKITAGA